MGHTFLALLPPPCYCFSPKSQLFCPICIPGAEPQMVVYTFYSLWTQPEPSTHGGAVAWISLHCCCGLLGRTHVAPSGLCWEKHLVTLCVTAPGAASCQCLAPLLGECWQAPSQKNNIIGKISMITRQENIPICFLQQVLSFFSTMHGLWAGRSCSLLPDSSCRDFGWALRFSRDVFVCTHPEKGFPKHTVSSLCC